MHALQNLTHRRTANSVPRAQLGGPRSVASLFSPQLKRLFSYVRPYTFRLARGVVLVAFVAIADGLVAFMARIAWDYVLTPTAPSTQLPLFTVGGHTTY